MKRYIFQGSSDDTFGEYEQTSDDYDNCATGEPIQFRLSTPDGAGVIVTGMYCNEANRGDGWLIGAETLDEDKPIDWAITLHPSYEGYRGMMRVDAPDDATLTCLNRVA